MEWVLIILDKFFIGHLFWLRELKIEDDFLVILVKDDFLAILVFIGISELFIIYYFLAVYFEDRI